MAMMACGDVRMPAGFDVGIHANRGGRGIAEARGFAGEHIELGRRLDIEEQNASAQSFANFLVRLADAGENNALTGNSDPLKAIQFAATDDVETRTESLERTQNREIRIRLHGITDGMRQTAEGAVETPVRRSERGAAVYIRRRADAGGDFSDGNSFAMERRIAPV